MVSDIGHDECVWRDAQLNDRNQDEKPVTLAPDIVDYQVYENVQADEKDGSELAQT